MHPTFMASIYKQGREQGRAATALSLYGGIHLSSRRQICLVKKLYDSTGQPLFDPGVRARTEMLLTFWNLRDTFTSIDFLLAPIDTVCAWGAGHKCTTEGLSGHLTSGVLATDGVKKRSPPRPGLGERVDALAATWAILESRDKPVGPSDAAATLATPERSANGWAGLATRDELADPPPDALIDARHWHRLLAVLCAKQG